MNNFFKSLSYIKKHNKKLTLHKESGQVLIVGVVMMVILLLLSLIAFDVGNSMRVKFKLEIAQQSAALAGATWQKESLNAIGPLNIIKACSALLEGPIEWDDALPQKYNEHNLVTEEYQKAIQGRLDMLTEMQTRISFIGPLIGFAAAQQAGKANGLSPSGKAQLQDYILTLRSDGRYNTESSRYVNNYDWLPSYLTMLNSIQESGIVVFPNARVAGRPEVNPDVLKWYEFYEELVKHDEEIGAGDQPLLTQTPWTYVRDFVIDYETWSDDKFRSKWWDIDYTMTNFPRESEIFPLGIVDSIASASSWSGVGNYQNLIANEVRNQLDKADMSVKDSVYLNQDVLPKLPPYGGMRFFCYDQTWYPDYFRKNYSDYEEEHFNFWFNKQVLRKEIKPAYRYEGPAAYTESDPVYLDIGVQFNPLRTPKDGFIKKFETQPDKYGTNRQDPKENSSILTSYRPGAIAKTLGQLNQNNPPIAVPLVLPVFNEVTLMPTFMPIPKGFGVLRTKYGLLEQFLAWLSQEESYYEPKNVPTQEFIDNFINPLKLLGDGPSYRYYGFNPHTNIDINTISLEAKKSFLLNCPKNRANSLYSGQNPKGLGWLQEPRQFYNPNLKALSPNEQGEEISIISTEDFVNGGIALRIHSDSSIQNYYVIDSTGKIITNADSLDPTIQYNYGYVSGGPGADFGGYSKSPDTAKGPTRL